MSEEEIIGNINWAIHVNEMTKSINGDNTHISVNVLQGLLDLYNKEKEKNKNSVSKDKVKEKIDFLKDVLAFAETGRDEKSHNSS